MAGYSWRKWSLEAHLYFSPLPIVQLSELHPWNLKPTSSKNSRLTYDRETSPFSDFSWSFFQIFFWRLSLAIKIRLATQLGNARLLQTVLRYKSNYKCGAGWGEENSQGNFTWEEWRIGFLVATLPGVDLNYLRGSSLFFGHRWGQFSAPLPALWFSSAWTPAVHWLLGWHPPGPWNKYHGEREKREWLYNRQECKDFPHTIHFLFLPPPTFCTTHP